jgi:hypothetical protein
VENIDRIDLDQTCTAREVINLLRARSFVPYRGAYFVEGRKKVFLTVSLEAVPLEGQE